MMRTFAIVTSLVLAGCGSDTSHPPNLKAGAGGAGGIAGGGATGGGAGGFGGFGASGGSGGLAGAGNTGGASGAGGACAPGSATPPVGDPTPCLVSENIVVFDGQTGDYIHPGDATITAAAFSAVTETDAVRVHVIPTDETQGSTWELWFSSKALGTPLVPGVYLDAERAPFASPGHPGLDVGGDGKGCNTLSGSFQIHALEPAGCGFLATFEQSCETTMPALRGCVHFRE